MYADFKPAYGRITLTSIIGRGIMHEIECPDSGEIELHNSIEKCKIALYSIDLQPRDKRLPLLVGRDSTGKILTDQECRGLLESGGTVISKSGRMLPHWLRTETVHGVLDEFVNTTRLIEDETAKLTDSQQEEVERIKQNSKRNKTVMAKEIVSLTADVDILRNELENATGDRMKMLTLNRKLSIIEQEKRKKSEQQFFNEMKIDVETEKQVDLFLNKEKLTVKAVQQFVVNIGGKSYG